MEAHEDKLDNKKFSITNTKSSIIYNILRTEITTPILF